MSTLTLPQTSLTVSRLAYGCMNLGGAWDRNPVTAAERHAAQAAVEAALAAGITLFDHADIYTHGKSEQVFGELLAASKDLRQKLVLQSKCGIRFANDPAPGAPKRYDFSFEHLVASVDGILKRLGVEHLDVLLLHRPDPLVEPAEVARAFDALERAGKVAHFGVSNHTPHQIELLKTCVRQPLRINQVELSLLHSYLLDEGVLFNRSGAGAQGGLAAGTLDYCRQHQILIQAWAPLAGGKLLKPLNDGEPHAAAARTVQALAKQKGCTPDALHVAWLLRHPAVIQPIIGSMTPSRIAAAAEAAHVTLSREEWYTLYIAGRGGELP